MSGSGGGPLAGGQGGGVDTELTPCDSLIFEAHLVSVDQAVAAGVSVGDYLQVVDRPLASGTHAFTADTSNGDTVGGIVHRLPDLRRCMQAGYAYAAEVLTNQGGAVRVKVQPV